MQNCEIHLYQYPADTPYQPGQTVFITLRSNKATGRATIIERIEPAYPSEYSSSAAAAENYNGAERADSDSTSNNHRSTEYRYNIQYHHDNRTDNVRQGRLYRIYGTDHLPVTSTNSTSDPPTSIPPTSNHHCHCLECYASKQLSNTSLSHPSSTSTPSDTSSSPSATSQPSHPSITSASSQEPYSCPIVICSSTDDYRRLARSQVDSRDQVLEIGSSFGVCTSILAQHCRHVLGCDNSGDAVAEARARYPHLSFHILDALQSPGRLATLAAGCTAVFADIGGNREAPALVQLLPVLLAVVQPRLMVVKSEALFEEGQQWLGLGHHKKVLKRLKKRLEREGQHQVVRPVVAPAALPDGPLPGSAAWWAAMQGKYPAPESATNWAHISSAAGVSAGGREGGDGGAQRVLPWFAKARAGGFKLHPLKYPDSFTAAGVKVCRPFNYKGTGCWKGAECPFDHQHCHHCLQPGHVATACPVGL